MTVHSKPGVCAHGLKCQTTPSVSIYGHQHAPPTAPTALLIWLCCTEQALVSGAGGQISFYELTFLSFVALFFSNLIISICEGLQMCSQHLRGIACFSEIKIKRAADSTAQQVKLIACLLLKQIGDVEARLQMHCLCFLTGCNWVICN